MSQTKSYGYFALTAGPKPNSHETLKEANGYKMQRLGMEYFLKIFKHEVLGLSYDHSQNAKKNFFEAKGFNKLLANAEKDGADIVIYDAVGLLAKLSEKEAMRIRRELVDKGVNVHDVIRGECITNTSDSRFMYHHKLARLERERKSQKRCGTQGADRLKTRKATKMASAVAAKFDNNLQGVIEGVIEHKKKKEKVTLKVIADGLNERGHQTRTGVDWTAGNVQRKLKKLEINWKA